MNDLEQAIAYHERKVNALKSAMPCDGCPIDECSEEHRQLAEWLRELRELRRNRIGKVSVGCATCIHMKTDDYTKRPCGICCNNYFSKYEAEVNANDT